MTKTRNGIIFFSLVLGSYCPAGAQERLDFSTFWDEILFDLLQAEAQAGQEQ